MVTTDRSSKTEGVKSQHQVPKPRRPPTAEKKMEFYYGNVDHVAEEADEFYRKLLRLKSENKLYLGTVLSKLRETGKFKKPVVKWNTTTQPESVSSEESDGKESNSYCDNDEVIA